MLNVDLAGVEDIIQSTRTVAFGESELNANLEHIHHIYFIGILCRNQLQNIRNSILARICHI
jgi:hypothetical protein